MQARAEPEAGPAPIAEGDEEGDAAGSKLDLAPAPTALDCSLITPNPLISVAGVAAARQDADQLSSLDEGGSSLDRWAKPCFACRLRQYLRLSCQERCGSSMGKWKRSYPRCCVTEAQ